MPAALTALVAVGAGGLGMLVGVLLSRLVARFPDRERGRSVRPPWIEAWTAALFVLVALRFGAAWELPAYLWFAGAAVLLAVIDLQHKLLPDRITLPSIGIGAALLAAVAVATGDGAPLVRALLGALVLYVVFVVLVLISPRSIGMGDAKLAALLGLYLGWLGWDVLLLGAAAGFVVQAVLALVLLATRRIGLRGELPFGPAMLIGAAVAIGWSDSLLG